MPVRRRAVPKPVHKGLFADAHVRNTIANAQRGKIKAVSLNERALTQKQIGLLRKAGWKRVKVEGIGAYWTGPRKAK